MGGERKKTNNLTYMQPVGTKRALQRHSSLQLTLRFQNNGKDVFQTSWMGATSRELDSDESTENKKSACRRGSAIGLPSVMREEEEGEKKWIKKLKVWGEDRSLSCGPLWQICGGLGVWVSVTHQSTLFSDIWTFHQNCGRRVEKG